MSAEKTALYRHFDASGALLYVGVSVSAAARLEQHMRGSEWAAEISAVRIEYLPTREAALLAEKAAIIAEVPAWNKSHNKKILQATLSSTKKIYPKSIINLQSQLDRNKVVAKINANSLFDVLCEEMIKDTNAIVVSKEKLSALCNFEISLVESSLKYLELSKKIQIIRSKNTIAYVIGERINLCKLKSSAGIEWEFSATVIPNVGSPMTANVFL